MLSGDVSRLATTGRHNQHVGPPVRIAVERYHRAVGRPLRVSGKDRHRRQLKRVRSVRIGNPEFGVARTVRQEHHSATIGCQAGSQVTPRRRDRGSWRRGGRSPRPRRVDAPHVRVGEAPHIARAAARPPALATRRACHRPDRRMAAALACRPSRRPASTARLGPGTEFHDCRVSRLACLRRVSTSDARDRPRHPPVFQLEPVELTAAWSGVPAKDQRCRRQVRWPDRHP